MLTLKIPTREFFDEDKGEFVPKEGGTIQLEHSLISLSKWESIWHKPFIGKSNEQTREEIISYIKCMTMTQNVPDEVYESITQDEINQINQYINDSMTATWFNDKNAKHNAGGTGEMVTSELIYYWMIDLNIPIEVCQKWHLNRLLTLIRICRLKSSGGKKMSQRDVLQQNAMLNKARRKQHH